MNTMNSFILFTSQYEAIKELSFEEKGQLLDAIFMLAKSGKRPEIGNKAVKIAFNFIAKGIEDNERKYLSICEKRKEAIKKRYAKGRSNNTNVYKCIQMNTNVDNNNNNYNYNNNYDTNSSIDPTNSSLYTTKKQKKTRVCEKKENEDEYEKERWFIQLIRIFNSVLIANHSSIKQVRTISSSRRSALQLLTDKFGKNKENFIKAFSNIATSAFCNGHTDDRKRPVDFDWLIKEENFSRAYEGSI